MIAASLFDASRRWRRWPQRRRLEMPRSRRGARGRPAHAIAATPRRAEPTTGTPTIDTTQDIGKGRYQYYAFLARDPGSAETEEKPDGTVPFLKKTFEGWSPDIHAILDATREDEIEQRDLYDRPPSSLKPWSVGPVGLLGDSVHAMMPNLGQGGCQAIEDAIVLAEELKSFEIGDGCGRRVDELPE